jgi:outer membrane protein TolC
MSRRPLVLALALALPTFAMIDAASATDLMQTYELARAGDPQLAAAESGRLAQKEGAVQARAALLPQINGSETYTLKNSGGTTIDGPTVAMDTSAGFDFERATCGAVGTLSTWFHRATTSATPGTGGLGTCNKGVFINEFSDALGTGNYVYEFIELYNDK